MNSGCEYCSFVSVAVARKRTECRLISRDELEASGILDGQRAQQHGIDEREDGGVRADAQAQRQNDHGAKAGALSQLSGAALDVAQRRLERRDPTRIAAPLLHLFDAPHRAARLAFGFLARHSALDEFRDLPVVMKLELVGQLALHRVAPDDRGEPVLDVGQHVCLPSADAEDGVNRARQRPPRRRVRLELPPAARGQRVVLRVPVVVRRSPLGANQTAALEAVKRRVQRALLHLYDAGRDLLEPFGNRPPVLRAERDGLEDEKIQGPLRQVDAFRVHRVLP